jgi:circadian clock protein KaiC
MPKKHTQSRKALAGIEKCPTGIRGLDEITFGGLPRGRSTLICGGAGSGKTLLAMEFIIHGIRDFGEPGVFMAFEETAEDLTKNVASLGFDLDDLVRRKKLAVDYVRIERSEIEETGEYNLEGLFVRLNSMIEEVGAKRVAIDTIEALFAGLPNEAILRAELRRLFRWLKDRNVTAVITGEQGERTLTRHGLEEYVSDCVIFLDHRVSDPDRRARPEHSADQLAGPGLWRRHRAHPDGRRPLGRDAGRQGLLSRQQHPGHGQRGHGQDQPGGRFRRCGLPTGRTLPLLGL